MKNFKYRNPVKILFGEGMIKEINKEIAQEERILLIYGGGSIFKNGVYKQVIEALEGCQLFEFGGIEPNPHYETCVKAVEFIHKESITFVLAVGGGSVIDATKFIVAAACYKGDAWDLMLGNAPIKAALPFGTVLTLPATGSEMNSGFVITKHATQEKLAMGSPLCFPQFSVLDPLTTLSLPAMQTANGIIDAFVHVTEQYVTCPQDAPLQDRFAESILQVLVEEGKKVMANPNNLAARANIMWAATWALNNWIGQGVDDDWATHMIGHELTAFHGIDHGQTLAIVLPGLLDVMRSYKKAKIIQMGERVFHIHANNGQEAINQTIEAIEKFFNSLGIKTRLSDYNVTETVIPKIVQRFQERGWLLGEEEQITPEIVAEILRRRL
ncbi:MAG: iron-containing alcohol dehydrogenase [Bacteroidales bacterium]|jgi:NADP-dependent alcohol dehydrogenase|nr:iron-containing alcohol dehydrogenase [Bacteroidales bacterium]